MFVGISEQETLVYVEEHTFRVRLRAGKEFCRKNTILNYWRTRN